ncbi:ATP-binding protein [Streptomyces sp. NPDC094149]|uniref:ATP-binding protein n=1 Tax=Streptomyces sp. NPDC094149 TaxID=3155079 RepID=UPI00331B654D
MTHPRAPAEQPVLPRNVGTTTLPPRSHRLTLPAAEITVPIARHTVMGILGHWGLPGTSDAAATVELVLSELITNAVRHSRETTARVTVSLEAWADGMVQLGIGDDNPGVPSARRVSPDAENGRGLAMAELLAAELGGDIAMERHPDGSKTVWAYFPGILAPAGFSPPPLAHGTPRQTAGAAA